MSVVSNLLSGLFGAVIGAAIGAMLVLYFQFFQVGSIEPAASSPLVRNLSGANSPLTFALGMTLTNTGGRARCLWDVALRVKATRTETKWSYFPAFVLDYRQYIALMGQAKPFDSAIEQPYTPQVVPGRTAIGRSFLFLPRPPKDIPTHVLAARGLVPGERYALTLYSKESGERCEESSIPADYLPKITLSFEFNADQIGTLKQGLGVVLVDVARDQSREAFIRKK